MLSLSNWLTNNLPFTVLTFFVIMLLSIAWNIYLQVQLVKIKQRQKSIFNGKNNEDLEEVIIANKQKVEKLDNDIEDLYKISEQIHKIASKGIQKVGLVRFNPFKDTGGNQSFTIALLDAANNGVVISSLYARDETRIYSKPVSSGISEFQLSEEEKQAIKKALDGK